MNLARGAFVEVAGVHMRARFYLFVLLVCTGFITAAPAAAQQTKSGAPAPQSASGDVAVTVTYTGKGAVDATHEILVFLFADPNVGPNSRPLGAPQIATKNGQTVTFKGVTTSPVYVLAIYDEAANYDGQSGPPPAGTPIGFYAKDAKSPPTAVTPGPKAVLKLSFTGARRWGK